MLLFAKDEKKEYIGKIGCLMKGQINIYRQNIRQLQYRIISIWQLKNIYVLWRWKVPYVFFFQDYSRK